VRRLAPAGPAAAAAGSRGGRLRAGMRLTAVNGSLVDTTHCDLSDCLAALAAPCELTFAPEGCMEKPEVEARTLERLVEELDKQGWLDRTWENLNTEKDKDGTTWLRKIKNHETEIQRGIYNLDKHDRWFGVWKTRGGLRRRVDLVLPPLRMWAHALIGWTGSIMLNRWCRRYARDNLGLAMTNHGLVRLRDLQMVPEETHGWVPTTERDVWKVLGLPFVEVTDRAA
jgi:hypothetical protein